MHSVVVFGDVRHHILDSREEKWTGRSFVPGGAYLMQRTVASALEELPKWHDKPAVLGFEIPINAHDHIDESIDVNALVNWTLKSRKLPDHDGARFRLFEGALKEGAFWPVISSDLRNRLLTGKFEDSSPEVPDVLVLDDLGLLLKTQEVLEFPLELIDSKKGDVQKMCEAELMSADTTDEKKFQAALSMLVARLRFGVGAGQHDQLEPVIVASVSGGMLNPGPRIADEGGSSGVKSVDGLINPHHFNSVWRVLQRDRQLRRRTVVLLDVDSLRSVPLPITSAFSWERTAQDTIVALRRHAAMRNWLNFGHVIVRFGVTGALHIENHNGQHCYTLYFDPRHDDRTWADPARDGVVLGASSVFAASLVEHLTRHCNERGGGQGFLTVGDLGASVGAAIQTAIPRCQRLVAWGYGAPASDTSEHVRIESDNFPISRNLFLPPGFEIDSDSKKQVARWIPKVAVPETPSRLWSILNQSAHLDVTEVARSIVKNGLPRVLNRCKPDQHALMEWCLRHLPAGLFEAELEKVDMDSEDCVTEFLRSLFENDSGINYFFRCEVATRYLGEKTCDRIRERLQSGCSSTKFTDQQLGRFRERLQGSLRTLQWTSEARLQASYASAIDGMGEKLRRWAASDRQSPDSVEAMWRFLRALHHLFEVTANSELGRFKNLKATCASNLDPLFAPRQAPAAAPDVQLLSGCAAELHRKARPLKRWLDGIGESVARGTFGSERRKQAWKLFQRTLGALLDERRWIRDCVDENAPSIAAPMLRLGTRQDLRSDRRLIIVDRREIEGIRTIQRLIEEHFDQIQKKKADRPLSIAVFGPPGSGKSTAVRRIIQMTDQGNPKIETKILTFNLSQFTSVSELNEAFKKIADAITATQVPIVFFDEFDARLGNDALGWLKFFLAAMEDGEYQGSTVKHAIFVFAGGTSSTFSEFSLAGRQESDQLIRFSQAKAPDFVSRLKGHLNVVGINNVDPDDELYLIRRAILIRDVLTVEQDLKKGELARIDPEMLDAVLHVPEYKHGGRSARMLLQMCMTHGRRVAMSAVPPVHQLNMQVDGNAFMKLIHQPASAEPDELRLPQR